MKLLKVLLPLIACLFFFAPPVSATVPSSTAYAQYVLTSNPQTLPIPFVFLNAGDVLVLDSKASPPVTLTISSDYSVSGGAGSTGSVTTIAGGANGVQVGDTITISRRVPLTQTTTFLNGGPLTAAMIGQAFDKVTEITQQLNLRALNSLQFQQDEQMSGVLPKTARANTILGFGPTGNVVLYPGTVIPSIASGSYVIATGSTTPRTLADRFAEVFDVKDYGALGTGSADDTLAVQRTVTAALAFVNANVNNAAQVYFPAGSYQMSSGVTINHSRVGIRGAGRGLSYIFYTGTTGDVIRYYNASSAVLHFEVSDISVYCSGDVTAGAILHLMNCGNVSVHDVDLQEGFGGLQIESGSDIHVSHLAIFTDTNWSGQRANSFGLWIKRLGTLGTLPSEIFFSDLNIRGQTGNDYLSVPVLISCGDGLWFENVHVGFCFGPCIFYGPVNANDQITGVTWSNFWLDGGASGIQYSDNGITPTAVAGWHHYVNGIIEGGTAVSGAGVDAALTTLTYGVDFTNCVFGRNANGYPVRLALGKNFTFQACKFADWVLASTPGINVINAVSSVNVSGCQFFTTGAPYADLDNSVTVSGTADYVNFTGNSTRNTTKNPLTVTSSGVNISASGNLFNASTTIASAAPLALPGAGEAFVVSGTTNFSALSGGRVNRTVRLEFLGALTVTSGANLKVGGGTYTTAANGTLTLFTIDGTNWFELARSVN